MRIEIELGGRDAELAMRFAHANGMTVEEYIMAAIRERLDDEQAIAEYRKKEQDMSFPHKDVGDLFGIC